MARFPSRPALAAGLLLSLTLAPVRAQDAEPGDPAPAAADSFDLDFGFEAKFHFRDSQELAFPSPFPFPPSFLPPGETQGFLRTVDPGSHFEVSVLTLLVDARWGENLRAHAKVDVVDLHDRNPTSSDRNLDVDELWIRFGSDPSRVPEGFGLYARVGKFAHFERNDDRRLESYGLVSTAFNRFEDAGLELGADLGRHVYLRLSLTQGNPVFLRDPNALAGDNGTPETDPRVHPNPEPELGSGFPIFYDAEVEDLDVDGDFETGGGLGLRFGDPDFGPSVDLLGFYYERELAERAPLHGTFYGGDLDLLDGPIEGFGLPITSDRKREVGGNLRVRAGGFVFFGQYVAQELAGLDRTGYEGEAAWRFELPLVWAVGGRQLFPSIQPAIRYSKLEPEFAGPSPQFPAVSARWDWVKVDYGVRLGIVEGIDLTAEYADNTLTTAAGVDLSEDELLVTLRVRR